MRSKILKSCTQKINLINVYGPTENIVFSTACQINQNNVNTLLIGKTLHSKRCYILDNHLRPLPIGAIGELYIGGDGVARGYLNLPELTKKTLWLIHFKQKRKKE